MGPREDGADIASLAELKETANRGGLLFRPRHRTRTGDRGGGRSAAGPEWKSSFIRCVKESVQNRPLSELSHSLIRSRPLLKPPRGSARSQFKVIAGNTIKRAFTIDPRSSRSNRESIIVAPHFGHGGRSSLRCGKYELADMNEPRCFESAPPLCAGGRGMGMHRAGALRSRCARDQCVGRDGEIAVSANNSHRHVSAAKRF